MLCFRKILVSWFKVQCLKSNKLSCFRNTQLVMFQKRTSFHVSVKATCYVSETYKLQCFKLYFIFEKHSSFYVSETLKLHVLFQNTLVHLLRTHKLLYVRDISFWVSQKNAFYHVSETYYFPCFSNKPRYMFQNIQIAIFQKQTSFHRNIQVSFQRNTQLFMFKKYISFHASETCKFSCFRNIQWLCSRKIQIVTFRKHAHCHVSETYKSPCLRNITKSKTYKCHDSVI